MDGPSLSSWMNWYEGGSSRTSRRWTLHGGHDAPGTPHRAAPAGVRRRSETSPTMGGSKRPKYDLVLLDGARGEGGGQILRTALSLSLITGRPFRIERIRANREQPGLRPQYLAAVQAAAELSNADVDGAEVGSRELVFRPGEFTPRDLTFDIGTAGATALVLQTLHLPIAMRAEGPVLVRLLGGTFNTKAPSFPFLARTWRDYLRRMGLEISLAMPRAGFYPRGGGHLEAWIEPGKPKALNLTERPPLTRLVGEAGIANLPGRLIAERLGDRASLRLAERGLSVDISRIEWRSPGQGAVLSLSAIHGDVTTTFVSLGERGKPSEAVADEAVSALLDYEHHPGAVDEHSADQLLLPLALADAPSTYTVTRITDHLLTNAETIGSFIDRDIRIDEDANRVTIA